MSTGEHVKNRAARAVAWLSRPIVPVMVAFAVAGCVVEECEIRDRDEPLIDRQGDASTGDASEVEPGR